VARRPALINENRDGVKPRSRRLVVFSNDCI